MPNTAQPTEGPEAIEDFRAESDLHTLIEAEKIKRDKPRYAAAMVAHKKHKTNLDAIAAQAAKGAKLMK